MHPTFPRSNLWSHHTFAGLRRVSCFGGRRGRCFPLGCGLWCAQDRDRGSAMKPRHILFGLLSALVGAWSASAVAKEKSSEAIWYEATEAGCKADAKKYYSTIYFKKRRRS